jgi:hypothetical protein
MLFLARKGGHLMPSKHTIKAWNGEETQLMLLYGMDLNHPEIGLPKFGSGIRMEELLDIRVETFQLTMGSKVGGYVLSRRGKQIHESSTFPTLLNLAGYFRHIAGGEVEALQTLSERHPGPTANFTRLLLHDGEDQFFHEHVEPLRNYLEWKWQMYFYCIPATSYERWLMGGAGRLRFGDPLVLTLLPKFPQVALDRGEQEAKLPYLAQQVLWLVRSHLCVNRKLTVDEEEDLIAVITAWRDYVTPFQFLVELDKMEQNNPYFMTKEVRNKLLPGGVFVDLLRLPGEKHDDR